MTTEVDMTVGEPGNFADNIHRIDYLGPYADPVADASSLIDLALRETESLNGPWHFAIDPYDTCLRARWFEENYADEEGRPYPVDFSFDEWEQVPVPSCWNMACDLWHWYEGSAVYVRNFSCEAPGVGRTFLHFDGAAQRAYVFLNGCYVGRHEGGSTPFDIEVTSTVQEDNRLVVVVNNTRRADGVPTDNTDWFNYGGLHRPVSLVRLPETFIETARVGLRPDGQFSTITLGLTVSGPQIDGRAEVSIPDLDLRAGLDVVGGVGAEEFSCSPKLWSPESPTLYDVYIRYGTDEWHDRIGFREIRVEGMDILLNGAPIYLKGISQHEDSVDNGRSLTEAEIRENFQLAKDLGCRFIRLAHYPHSPLTARIADEVGMLLWEEIPVYWAILFDNEEVFADADNQLRELILRDRNRASVIVWSVGNENPDLDARLDFMSRLVDTCRGLDPSRLVSAACLVDPTIPAIVDRLADALDIIGVNEYYGWYEPDFSRLALTLENSHPTKPIIITEFGADAVVGLRGGEDELFTEDKQRAVYLKQREVLSSIPYVKGTTPWIFYDFRCPRRVNVRQGYYNRKGLLSADRTVRKLAYFVVQDWYQAIA